MLSATQFNPRTNLRKDPRKDFRKDFRQSLRKEHRQWHKRTPPWGATPPSLCSYLRSAEKRVDGRHDDSYDEPHIYNVIT